MAINFVANLTPVFSTGDPALNFSTITAAGRYLLAFVHTKPDSTPATTPSGWTFLGAMASTTGISQGNDAGDTRVGVFGRLADGFEGSVTFAVPSNNVSGAWATACTSGTGAFETPVVVTTQDASTGNSVWQGSFPSLSFLTGDGFAWAGTLPTDAVTAATISTPTFWTASLTRNPSSNGSGLGRDIAIGGQLLVRTGVGGAQSMIPGGTAIAGSTATYGPFIGVLLREQAAAGPLTSQKAGMVPIF